MIILDFSFLVCRCFFKSFIYSFSFLAPEVTTTEGKSIIEVTVIILYFPFLVCRYFFKSFYLCIFFFSLRSNNYRR